MASMDWTQMFGQGYTPEAGVANVQPAPQPAPPSSGGGSDALDALIEKLVAGYQPPRQGLAQKVGPLNVPFEPINPYRQQPGQHFLRGLVSGFNGRAQRTDDQSQNLRAILSLMEGRSRVKAAEALAGERSARMAHIAHTDEDGADAENVDPYADEKRRWWESRIGANDALAEARRRPKPVAAGRSGGGSHAGGGGPTMAQKRAQINSLAQAEKQRVANNIKNKYRNVYDYDNPTTGTPEGKRTVDAAIARGIAQVEQEHARVLRNLGADYGMEQGEDAPINAKKADPLGLR